MSSYTVAKAVIDALVTAAVKWAEDVPGGFRYHWNHGAGQVNAATATQVGQMLWRANWKHAEGWALEAVRVESEQVPPKPVFKYEPLPGVPDPLIVLRLIENYVYQTADEPEQWRPTEAFGFVHALQSAAIGRLLRETELPWTLGENKRDVFLRYGQPDPEPEPADYENPEWVSVNAKLSATGIPFKVDTPAERRNRAADDGTVPAGRWLTWPPDLGHALVMVGLYRREAEAEAAFATFTETAHFRLGPRFSVEVRRQGATVLVVHTDHWNPDLGVWLDRLRNEFTPLDDYWSVSHAQQAARAPIIILGRDEEHQSWTIGQTGEPTLTGVLNLAEAHLAAQQRETPLLITDDIYAAMVGRGDAPAERPTWALPRPTGGPRLP